MNNITDLFLEHIRVFKNSSLKNNNLIEFNIPFNFSNLNKIKDGIIIYQNKEISIKESLNRLDNAIKNNNIIRVWSSHIDPDHYMFLLFICSYLKERIDKIIVCFTDDYNKDCRNTGMITNDEIDKISILGYEINKDEINKYAKEWDKLNKSNEVIHIFKNNQLVEVSYDYFYRQIIDILKNEGKKQVADIVLYMVDKYNINIDNLIKNLIDNKKVKVIDKNEILSKCIIGLN